MKTNTTFAINNKDNTTFALALGAAAVALVTLFANNVNANTKVASEVQMLDTIVVTAPRIHTVKLDTIVVTASRYIGHANMIIAAK